MRLLASALVFLALIGIAQAGPHGGGRLPVQIKIEGHVGPPRPGETVIAELQLRHDRETIVFQVREIWVLSGNAAGVDVLHEVEPYKPNMTLTGPAEVVNHLVKASPDEQVDVIGYFRRGARMLMLSSIEPAGKR